MSCSSAAVLTPWISCVRQSGRFREPGRVHLHAPDVRLRRLILGVDGARQRFDGREVQVRGLLDVPLLVLDAAHVDLVGAVGRDRAARTSAAPPSSPRGARTTAASAAVPAPTK